MKNNKLNIMIKKEFKLEKLTLRKRLRRMGYIVTNDIFFDSRMIKDTDGNEYGYMTPTQARKFLKTING